MALSLVVGALAFPQLSLTQGLVASPPANGAARNTVDNLRAFAKLYGYVRYFHPSDEASAIDWERFAIHGVRQVKDATGPDGLRARLEALFAPIAPTLRLYGADDDPPVQAAVLTPDDTTGLELVAWQHQGVGLGNTGPYHSIRLNRKTEISTGHGFGPVSQRVDAAPYRGMEVRLAAVVRAAVSGGGNQAQLWLRVDRPNRAIGFFDNMGDRPVTSAEWQRYEITGTVAEDADAIVFGGFLAGAGEAWFDEFELLVRNASEEEWTAVPVSNTGFETAMSAELPGDWVARAPGYRFTTTAAEPYEGEHSLVITSSKTERMAGSLFDARPAAGEQVRRSLGSYLVAEIPLALFGTDGQTLSPENAVPLSQLQGELETVTLDGITAADEALRYADIVIAWNVFQHFYPYLDVVDVDWDAVLTETLRRASDDRGPRDFLYTLRWLVAQLDDGHGNVTHPLMREHAGMPLLVDEVEDEIVVTAIDPAREEDSCVERGDIVVSIDDAPARQVLEDAKRFISGSPQWKAHRALRELGRGERGSLATLVLQRPGRTLTCDVVRDFDGVVEEPRPDPLESIDESIYYVDLSRASIEAIEEHAQALAAATGIVFDLRGYPNGNHDVLRHLTTDRLRSAHWQVPQRIYPDQMDLVGYSESRWTLEPKLPHFAGTAVFLTDARAISYAESVMGIVEHYELAEIVGRPTAGANGNVNPFTLPGGYRVSWTGMRVTKHDGSQHHLIGIQPTVPVERTLEGVRAGRDEDLENALEMITATVDR